MAQASPTTCAHNAPGQVLVPGRPIACLECGAQIQPTPRAVNSGGQLIAGEKQVNATYPADSKSASATYAFAR
jgi:hypothetical protein